MHSSLVAACGTIASILSTLSLVPQVVRTWRTQSARDISAVWLIVALISMLLWIGYGLMIGALAVVWANALTAVQAGYILRVKLMQGALPSAGQGAETMIYPPTGIAASKLGMNGDLT
jgi:MtN3 and saliva related transmembrane protein